MNDPEPPFPDAPVETNGELEVIYRTSHDMTTNGLDVSVALALEEAVGIDAAETISTFSAYADPDAFNRLFRVGPDDDTRPGGMIELTVEGCHVMIQSDGEIVICR